MKNALLQRQNLTLKAIQVQQGRRRPKSVEIPFYPIKDCSVLTLSYHQKYLYSQRVSPPFKNAVKCSQRAMLPIQTQYRKFEKNIPRKEIARGQSQFPHSCVCERFIYSQDWSAFSAAGKYVDRFWEYINRSQTHECGNWDCMRPRNSFSGNT
jgi:hypothetical protein